MTYHGPPNQYERNRNKGRKDPNRRSFEFGYEVNQDVGITDGAGIRRRKDLAANQVYHSDHHEHHHQHEKKQRRRNQVRDE